MQPDPMSREAALQRVKEAGRNAGAWGGPKEANPYGRSPSMHAESAAWLAGHAIGAAERKRKP